MKSSPADGELGGPAELIKAVNPTTVGITMPPKIRPKNPDPGGRLQWAALVLVVCVAAAAAIGVYMYSVPSAPGRAAAAEGMLNNKVAAAKLPFDPDDFADFKGWAQAGAKSLDRLEGNELQASEKI